MTTTCVSFNCFSPQQVNAINYTCLTLTLLYIFVQFALIFNLYTYIYKQKYYRIVSVVFFYFFASVTVISRIAGYLDIFLVADKKIDSNIQVYWQTSIIATFFMIAVGVQIAKSMLELTVMMRYDNDESEIKLRSINIVCYTVYVVLLIF